MRRSLRLALLIVLGAAAPAVAQFPTSTLTFTTAALTGRSTHGVRRAIVSSTPDDGTLKLYEKAPKGVVPFLRPYRTRDDMGSWPSDPGVQAYVEERLKRGIYRGSEFHLGVQAWLAQLPRNVAGAIAWKNGERLFPVTTEEDAAGQRTRPARWRSSSEVQPPVSRSPRRDVRDEAPRGLNRLRKPTP